jgi:TPR repeat protein
MFRIHALASILLILAAPVRADIAAGLAAYDSGDYRGARIAWSVCAENGDPDAQVALAGLYAGGVGVARNFATAAAWFRRAARQGDAIAQLNLGEMYANGLGVDRDPVAAWVWLGLAARAGNDWARERRDAIAKGLTPARRRDAQRRLEAWR